MYTIRRRRCHSEELHQSVKSGFTLIELLITIAIINLLAAVLFPVSRQASCLQRM
jgi:prepilin-type N-terminal cleavage/methylation domain-containing protein